MSVFEYVLILLAAICLSNFITKIYTSRIRTHRTNNLSIVSDSIWSVLSFSLEVLVFLILGTQLPKILITMELNNYPISTWEIVAYVLLITFLFLVTRFVWSMVTIKKKTYDDLEHPVSKFRAGIIFSLSGARGAVTLASVMSIPPPVNHLRHFPRT